MNRLDDVCQAIFAEAVQRFQRMFEVLSVLNVPNQLPNKISMKSISIKIILLLLQTISALMQPSLLHLSHVRQEEELNLTAQMDGFHVTVIRVLNVLVLCTWMKVSLQRGAKFTKT